MNENLNLIEILKNVPKGTKLWTPLAGEVEFLYVLSNTKDEYPIKTAFGKNSMSFLSDGRYLANEQGQCMLFPSEDQRDWSQFKAPKAKVKHTLHPFDRVLVRDEDHDKWKTDIFSHYRDNEPEHYVCTNSSWIQCIPYNEMTAPLLGTADPCPIDYDIECSKDYVPEK